MVEYVLPESRCSGGTPRPSMCWMSMSRWDLEIEVMLSSCVGRDKNPAEILNRAARGVH
jgi:hypothetical protein